MTKINLHNTIDAVIWTDEWLKVLQRHPDIPTDRGTMIGWFANAIMAGYDEGRRVEEELWLSKENTPRSAKNSE